MENINREVFCTLPFVHINNRVDGRICACCHIAEPIKRKDGTDYNINEGSTFEEAFRSEDMESLRRNMLAGIKDERCSLCWKHESQGLDSKRKHDGERFLAATLQRLQEPILPFKPLSWDIKLGSNCNLKCRMCFPETSAAIMKEAIANGWQDAEVGGVYLRKNGNFLQYPTFSEELKHLIKFAEEIYFLGGEPTLIRGHLELLDFAIEQGVSKNMTVRWSTNLSRFDQEFILRARQFKKVTLDCSVDGYGPVNEYIRFPSLWSEFNSRIQHIKEALPNAKIMGICTVQIYNAFELEKLLAWGEANQIRVAFNYLEFPHCLSTQCLPTLTKQLLDEKYASINDPRLQDFRKWLALPSKEELFPEFLAYTQRLDAARQQNFFDLIPEEFRHSLSQTKPQHYPLLSTCL